MLRRLFSRTAQRPAPASSTGGALIYAIGDIHGRRDLLDPLIAKIRADADALDGQPRPVIIFVGDYVDRGPDSRGVVDAILALAEDPGVDVRVLKGNHEEQLLLFTTDPRAGPAWAAFGGAETLASYGVTPPATRTDVEAWEEVRQAFCEHLPQAHRAFFDGLELAVVCGDYVFVHAGVRPGVPLNEQSERDLMWIRDDFLSSPQRFEKVVVHGHTPEPAPHDGHNRIGIDTGAYATATLTAVRLWGSQRLFLQTTPRDR